MKSRILWLYLLSGLFVLPCCQRSRALGPPKAVAVREDGAIALNLMSFNIRYETPEDLFARSWRQRVIGAVRMIHREEPHIIGVQEALHGQAADLWASLPDFEFFGIGRDDGRREGEYSGIFYRKDRFRLDTSDCGTFWLSDSPSTPGSHTWGNEIPRIAAWVRLVDLATMRGFYVFNTHWDHRNQPSRERAALLIAERIDARQHAEDPVALIGDFNSNESNPGIIYLTGESGNVAGAPRSWANGLLDTYQNFHPGEKNRRSLHFWSGSREGDVKVDHIFVSRGSKIEAAEIISRDQPVVSDHFPVTARVLFSLTE